MCFTWSTDRRETVKWSHGQETMPGHVIRGGNGVVHMDGGMLRLAVVEWRDCSAQVGVPARGLERGSCSTPQLPPCSPAAESDSATALCPSRAHVQDGNPPEEGPPGPAIKLVQVNFQVHLMSFELSLPQWVPIVGILGRSAARRSLCHGSTWQRPRPLAECAGSHDDNHVPEQVQQP